MNNFDLEPTDSKGHGHSVHVATLPDKCPCCHQGIEPLYKFSFFHDNDYPEQTLVFVQVVYQCPRLQCRRIFIADYVQDNRDHRQRPGKFELRGLSPLWFEKTVFPELIQKVSPSFGIIYNEAAHAEARGLTNVAGPGYRKALEFLIKDFLISREPEQGETIKATWLDNLIKTKIDDQNLKTCAKLATWLGNDETHYLRLWEDKDIGDLKKLITLTVNWTESCLLTDEFAKSMPQKSKKP